MDKVKNENLYEVIERHFPTEPEAPCLILPDSSVLGYGTIKQESARFAGLLTALGVRPGDRVAVQVKKSPQALFLYLGCLRTGAVYLPMNDAYQRLEIEYFLSDATPRVFGCGPQIRTTADELATKVGVTHVFELDGNGSGTLAEAAASQPDVFETISRGGNDLASIIYTSGTTGHTILERYGMTEGCMFTSNPCDGERRAGTVGFPLAGVSIRIADEGNRPVQEGEIGQIEVRGENVFRGYWQMPEKTKEEFTVDGFFKTGDLAKRDADGYISNAGRSKDLIITGGLNVYPKEIEDVIDVMPGVAESAVIGLPHADFGEAVAAIVLRKENKDGAALTEPGIIISLPGAH